MKKINILSYLCPGNCPNVVYTRKTQTVRTSRGILPYSAHVTPDGESGVQLSHAFCKNPVIRGQDIPLISISLQGASHEHRVEAPFPYGPAGLPLSSLGSRHSAAVLSLRRATVVFGGGSLRFFRLHERDND